MRWWSSKPQSGISTVLDSSNYFLFTYTPSPLYSSPHCSYRMRSFPHPGVARLHPIISAYLTISFTHPGIYRLRPSITFPLSTLPPPSGSYLLTLSPCCHILLASSKKPAKVAQSCVSVASCSHQASLLSQPPS